MGKISLLFFILKKRAVEKGSIRCVLHPVISMGGRYQNILFISLKALFYISWRDHGFGIQ